MGDGDRGAQAVLQLPVELSFPCRAPGADRARRHPVVIEPDWSVRTGHDENLEAIAQALGGGVSCRPALAGVLPGFRLWWDRTSRAGGCPIRSPDRGARWTTADDRQPCCPASGFAGPVAAAAHARSPRHVAAVAGVSARDLGSLVAGLGARADPPPPAAGSLVQQAWACGMSPPWAAAVTAGLDGLGPVSTELLAALAQTGADPSWLALTARRSNALDAAEWLAWTVTPLDVAVPGARAAWLRSGARRADIVALSLAGYGAHDVAGMARAWGISVPGAAQLVARWVAAGYRPTAEQLAWIDEEGRGFPPGPPAQGAVERVAAGLSLWCARRRLAVGCSGTRDGSGSRDAPGARDGSGSLDGAGARVAPGTWDAPSAWDGSPAQASTVLAVALARWGTVADTVASLRGGAEPPPPGEHVG